MSAQPTLIALTTQAYYRQHIDLYKYTLKVSDYLLSEKFNFNIYLKDGEEKQIRSAIKYDTIANKSYLEYENHNFLKSDSLRRFVKIYPNQTIKITRVDSATVFNRENTIIGIAADSCWMFKVELGEINAYSCLSKKRNHLKFDPASVVGIQSGDGPIVQLNENNLKEMVGQYYDAIEAIQEKNYFSAIKIYNRQKKKEAKKKSPNAGT